MRCVARIYAQAVGAAVLVSPPLFAPGTGERAAASAHAIAAGAPASHRARGGICEVADGLVPHIPLAHSVAIRGEVAELAEGAPLLRE